MQSEAACAQHDQCLAVVQPTAVETPEDLRHRTIRRRCDQVRHIVRHSIEVLVGLYDIVRCEGGSEMRRLIGMPRTDDLGGARRMIPADAVHASIAHRIVDRRDPIAFLYRHACPIRAYARAERLDAPAHLMPRHHAAPPELALPHMHFRAAYVGLRDGRNETASGRRGDVILVEFNFVCRGDERDTTFPGIASEAMMIAPVSSRTRKMSSPRKP